MGSTPISPTKYMKNIFEITSSAIQKIKEIKAATKPDTIALRVGVIGGGCSGFQYSLTFEDHSNPTDKLLDFDGLMVILDPVSEMYLKECTIDYLETLEESGFKFTNLQAKSTCGCGSSFSA
jgi:iron-sulfur cluster assembly accessory protein